MGDKRSSSPRFRRVGTPAPIQLTGDDIAILRHVYRHRFIRADDIYRLFPSRSPDKLSRRLTWLYRHEYLDRPIAQIDRFKTGGSQSLVYGIDAAGARILQDSEDATQRLPDWKSRNRTYTRENLDHTLAISRFMIDLELACACRADVDLIHFETLLKTAPIETQRLVQPARWPVVLPWQGNQATVQVAPDAIFGLRMHQSDGPPRRAFFFVEIDRGTMTIAPSNEVRRSEAFLYRSSILRKLLAYGVSHQGGIHQAAYDIHAAQVVTLTSTQARAREMQKVAAALIVPSLNIAPKLFLFGEHRHDQCPLDMVLSDANGGDAALLPR